jgi:formyltetrahydrofolate hydrolase
MEEKHALNHFNSDEEFKALPEFTLKDKYGYLKGKISEVIANKEQLETELAKAKIRWADMELQKDNLETRLN